MITVSARRLFFVAAATVFACSAASQTAAMTYSTAAYLGNDGYVVSGWGEIDDLTGCNSQIQNAQTDLWSPGGRYSNGWMSFDDEMGTWSTGTTFEVWCNCGSHVMSFYGGTSGEAADTTIEVKYKYVSAYENLSQQLKYCNFERCPSYPSTCGNGFQDVVGLTAPCVPGIWSTWSVKTFLGLAIRCEEITHIHMAAAPC